METWSVVEAREKAQRLLAEATARWSKRNPNVSIIDRAIYNHDAVHALVNEGSHAGLIVVGSRGRGGFLGLRFGSTVDGLVRHAPVPVAVVHGG